MCDIAIAEAIKAAHNRSGAPGRFIIYGCDNSDQSKGHYVVGLQFGEQRFQWKRNGDKLTVRCSWSISGDRQRKQATVKIEKLNENSIRESLATTRFH